MLTPSRGAGRSGALALAVVTGASGLFGLVMTAAGAAGANGPLYFAGDRDGDPEIFRIEADGSGLVQLTSNAAWDTDPSVAEDGTQIAFSSDRDGDDDIYLMAADGTGVRNLTSSGTGRDGAPDISPDGTMVAFERDGEVWLVATDGSSAPVALGAGHTPSWSPDGSRIAFERDGEIAVMDADGGNVTVIVAGADAADPEWSPDGARIAFVAAGLATDGLFHIYTATPEGGDLVQVTSHEIADDFDPAWSPDSALLAFTRIAVDADIFIVAAGGGDPGALTSGSAYDFTPAWGRCSGTACPQPTVSPSPTTSPSPSPTGGQRDPVFLGLTIAKTRRAVVARGELNPARPGRVRVTLSRRRGGDWVRVAARAVSAADGTYRTRFARPRAGRCRLQARWPGDASYLPASRTRRFTC